MSENEKLIDQEKPGFKMMCCFKKKKQDDDLIESIDIKLDGFGKYTILLSFALVQISSIFTFGIMFYQFHYRNCSPITYQLTSPFADSALGFIDYSYDYILLLSMLLGIVYKFGSIVSLFLALDEY